MISIKKIISIARYTLIENIRNKIFYVLILFGIIMITSSFLIAALGGEQPERILLDLGFGAIEFFALITMCFASVTLVLDEIESKTIYLVFTRPVSKISYLLGRYLGLISAIYLGLLVMSAVHMSVLFLSGWEFSLRYFIALFFLAEKITIIGALALLFSLFSTSSISSVSFTVFMWILGHFSEEIQFLSEKLPYFSLKVIAKISYYVVPNLQYFNYKEFWDLPSIAGTWLLFCFTYGVIYSAICLALSSVLLINKEF